jgi:hypothetical protein
MTVIEPGIQRGKVMFASTQAPPPVAGLVVFAIPAPAGRGGRSARPAQRRPPQRWSTHRNDNGDEEVASAAEFDARSPPIRLRDPDAVHASISNHSAACKPDDRTPERPEEPITNNLFATFDAARFAWLVSKFAPEVSGVSHAVLVSVSEIMPLRTEALVTNASAGVDGLEATPMKKSTTVAMDFGRIGTPRQRRFTWDDLVRGAIGAIITVDARDRNAGDRNAAKSALTAITEYALTSLTAAHR